MDSRDDAIKLITQNIRIVFKAVQAHSKYVEKECGMSSAKLWMLWELFATPGIKVSVLARALSIHPSTCSNMLDKLENQGFVARDRSKTDQRTVHLYLTESGTNLLANAPRPAQGLLSEALERLSDEHLDFLQNGLEGLVQTLKNTDEKAGMEPLNRP